MHRTNFNRISLALFIIISSCETDPTSLLCRLTSLTIVDGGSPVTQTYVYDGGKLSRMTSTSGDDSFQINYQYDDEGDLAKTFLIVSGDSVVTSYSHNNLHYVVASLFAHNGDTTETTYEYNLNGQLIRQRQDVVSAGVPAAIVTTYYTYPDLSTHNPSIIATVDIADSVVVHYEYDNKINPERGLYLPNIQPYNNITRVTGPTYEYAITYQYDSNGLPVSSLSTTGRTQNWVYICQVL